jgi:hypothetical protein
MRLCLKIESSVIAASLVQGVCGILCCLVSIAPPCHARQSAAGTMRCGWARKQFGDIDRAHLRCAVERRVAIGLRVETTSLRRLKSNALRGKDSARMFRIPAGDEARQRRSSSGPKRTVAAPSDTYKYNEVCVCVWHKVATDFVGGAQNAQREAAELSERHWRRCRR